MSSQDPKALPETPQKPLQRAPQLPGERAALPPGTVSGPFLGPQGDENRDPPANAPVPVTPAPTVENPDSEQLP